MRKNKILIVDDDKDIQDLLSYNLINQGYQVGIASTGNEAIKLLKSKYDLLISDIMMPEMSGYVLCQKIRESNTYNQNIPIIFLTAKNQESDELLGFEVGADDFIIKPISIRKLLARIKVHLKRSNSLDGAEDTISWGTLSINQTNRSLIIDSKLIKLTKTEFDLLFLLISKENKVFRRHELLKLIQDENIIVTDRVIDVHIKKIREKLLQYSSIIETVHGIGYVARKGNRPDKI